MERYGIKTRQAMYDRLNSLGLTLEKDASNRNYATPEQLVILDDLHQHLKGGGTLRTYTPPTETHLEDTVNHTVEDAVLDKGNDIPLDVFPSLDTLIDTILKRVLPTDELAHHATLERAYQQGWLLSTSEVKSLIGNKPRKSQHYFGCWLLEKTELRMGRETAWKVTKLV